MLQPLIKFVTLPTIQDDCLLAVAETPQIPFSIARVYYIYNAKPNLPRGFHAHKQTDQILFCLKGKVRMVLDDGERREEVVLSQPSRGVLLERMVWHEMHDLDQDALLLVLASAKFDPKDYIRDIEEFKKLTNK